MKKIRALVVEDSLTIRKRIVEVLNADPEIEVIAEAVDGKTAIHLCQVLRPDVVTLDMVLPVMSGVAATEYIMAHCPTPVLIVSGSTQRRELFQTYDALTAGALDVLEKPSNNIPDGEWEQELVQRVKLVSRIKVITHLRGRLPMPRLPDYPMVPGTVSSLRDDDYRVVGVGASTGGPSAFVEILRNLPPDFPLPILLVIHIGQAFGVAMAEWLDSQTSIRVSCARDGELLPPVGKPRVLLAPPGQHMIVSGGRVRLTDEAERFSCRPSVDVLFESLARELPRRTIGCLLTGMGRDGAQGVLSIRQEGGRTIVQNEASSIVFGMPQEAIRIGGAEQILGIHEIAPALVALSKRAERGRK